MGKMKEKYIELYNASENEEDFAQKVQAFMDSLEEPGYDIPDGIDYETPSKNPYKHFFGDDDKVQEWDFFEVQSVPIERWLSNVVETDKSSVTIKWHASINEMLNHINAMRDSKPSSDVGAIGSIGYRLFNMSIISSLQADINDRIQSKISWCVNIADELQEVITIPGNIHGIDVMVRELFIKSLDELSTSIHTYKML